MSNLIRKAIEKKGNALGTFLGVANTQVLECIGYSGLDFVVIDTEHGPYDTMPMSDMIKTAENAGLAPVVRIADVSHKEIQRAVDNGAQGIIAPCLRTVDEFKKVVELAKFAPLGNRGFIKARGSGFGNEAWADVPLEEYMKNSNDMVLVLPQCETREALEHIEEITAIDGLDGMFIGPFDLSICMGIPGQFTNPDFITAVEKIKKACHDCGKLCMMFTSSEKDARAYLESGMDAVANSIDSIVISNAFKEMVKNIR